VALAGALVAFQDSGEIRVATTATNPSAGVRKKVIAPAISGPGTRRSRAAAFEIFVLTSAVVFTALAVVAHFVPYFPLDLVVTRAVQTNHGAFFDRVMYAVSWVGFMPQAPLLAVGAILTLLLAGLQWEACAALFAVGGVGLGTLIKLVVYRPRPSPDLVHVLQQLNTSGFPSGHVLSTTAFCGFLLFLSYTLLKPPVRLVFVIPFAVLISLMGLSRIYQGEHWFSDVMGAYLLGSLWLALTIKFYRWGKPRFFVHQPVAPEAPGTQGD
jgi:membrane-associated phospholipid phosphatase